MIQLKYGGVQHPSAGQQQPSWGLVGSNHEHRGLVPAPGNKRRSTSPPMTGCRRDTARYPGPDHKRAFGGKSLPRGGRGTEPLLRDLASVQSTCNHHPTTTRTSVQLRWPAAVSKHNKPPCSQRQEKRGAVSMNNLQPACTSL